MALGTGAVDHADGRPGQAHGGAQPVDQIVQPGMLPLLARAGPDGPEHGVRGQPPQPQRQTARRPPRAPPRRSAGRPTAPAPRRPPRRRPAPGVRQMTDGPPSVGPDGAGFLAALPERSTAATATGGRDRPGGRSRVAGHRSLALRRQRPRSRTSRAAGSPTSSAMPSPTAAGLPPSRSRPPPCPPLRPPPWPPPRPRPAASAPRPRLPPAPPPADPARFRLRFRLRFRRRPDPARDRPAAGRPPCRPSPSRPAACGRPWAPDSPGAARLAGIGGFTHGPSSVRPLTARRPTIADRYQPSYHSARRSIDHRSARSAPAESQHRRDRPGRAGPPSGRTRPAGRPGPRPAPSASGRPVAGRHQHGTPAGRRPVAVDVTGHHHGAGGHGLEQHHAERLAAQRRGAQHVGRHQPPHLLLLGEHPEPDDVGRLGVASAERVGLGAVPGDPQHRAVAAPVARCRRPAAPAAAGRRPSSRTPQALALLVATEEQDGRAGRSATARHPGTGRPRPR